MIAKNTLLDGITAHIAASLQVDTSNAEEMAGLEAIARAALDYFSSSTRGAPLSGGKDALLLWAIYSGILEGKVPQERIDDFFQNFRFSIADVLAGDLADKLQFIALPRTVSLRGLESVVEASRGEPVTVVAIPGDINEMTVAEVAEGLLRAGKDATQKR